MKHVSPIGFLVSTVLLAAASGCAHAPRAHRDLHSASIDAPEMLQPLIDAGASLEARNTGHSTPLNTAVVHGSTQAVAVLLAAGADPNAMNDEGHSILSTAVLFRKPEAVSLLSQYGADLQATHVNKTPLELAVMSVRDNAVLTALLGHPDLEIDAKDPENGDTALHWAVAGNNLTAANTLLEFGASPEVANEKGQTALDLVGKRYGPNLEVTAIQRVFTGRGFSIAPPPDYCADDHRHDANTHASASGSKPE